MSNDTALPRIAFNAHLLAAEQSYRSAGLSMYIDQLVQHLDQLPKTFDMDVYVGKGVGVSVQSVIKRSSRVRTHSPSRRILWEQLCQPWHLLSGNYALMHAPAFVTPVISPCKRVVTIHDLSFVRYPQYFRGINRVYLNLMTRISCRSANAVITGAQYAAREIHDVYGVPMSRIRVVPHGVDQRFRLLKAETIHAFRKAKDLPDRYILFLGTLEPRKNLVRLVQAYARSGIRDMPLVIAGGKGWYYEDVYAEVQKHALQSNVRFTGYVPAQEIALWYNAAWAFAYVSIYEGFGLPVLEALACGLPVLTSATTSLPEASGGHAVSVDPLDVTAIASGLHSIVNDYSLRESLRAAGLEYANQFSWQRAARETASVYHEVINKRGKL